MPKLGTLYFLSGHIGCHTLRVPSRKILFFPPDLVSSVLVEHDSWFSWGLYDPGNKVEAFSPQWRQPEPISKSSYNVFHNLWELFLRNTWAFLSYLSSTRALSPLLIRWQKGRGEVEILPSGEWGWAEHEESFYFREIFLALIDPLKPLFLI